MRFDMANHHGHGAQKSDERRDADVYEEIRRGFHGPRPARPKITRVTSGHFEAAYHGSGSPPRRVDTPTPEPPVEINLATDPGLGPGNTVLPNPSPFASLFGPTPPPPPMGLGLGGRSARDADTVPTHQRIAPFSGWQMTGAVVGLLLLALACVAAFVGPRSQ